MRTSYNSTTPFTHNLKLHTGRSCRTNKKKYNDIHDHNSNYNFKTKNVQYIVKFDDR